MDKPQLNKMICKPQRSLLQLRHKLKVKTVLVKSIDILKEQNTTALQESIHFYSDFD